MHYLDGSRQTFAQGVREVSKRKKKKAKFGLRGEGDDGGPLCVDHMSGGK